MTETANYKLKKPEENDWADIAVLNENADAIDTALHGKLDAEQLGVPGGVAGLDETGKVPGEQLPAMNYDPAGSADGVRAELTSHTGNKSNPHGVTKAQVGLGNVDNTADLSKPISTATQQALNGKANASHQHGTGDITSGTLPVARGGTGQTTLSPAVTVAAARAIYAGTADMTAGSTALTTGTIYLVYE